MLPSPDSPFAKLRARMLEGTTRAYTLEYYQHQTKPNLIALIKHANLPEAALILYRLQSCTVKHPCRAITCPVCGEKLKARARDESLKRVVERLGRFPEDFEISFVTVDGPYTVLEIEPARDALRRFEWQLNNFIRRPAKGTGWTGFVDISTDGMIHFHGLVLHPDMPRNALEARLKESFPGPNQVKVSKWKRSLSLGENLQNTFNYSLPAGRHVGVVTRSDGPDRHLTPANVVDVVKRILVVQALAGKGFQGLRFIRNMRPIMKGLRVPELESLQRRTKRVRMNTKTIPNMPWAPRGQIGTHLGLTKNTNQDEIGKYSVPPATDDRFEGGVNTVTGVGPWPQPEPNRKEESDHDGNRLATPAIVRFGDLGEQDR